MYPMKKLILTIMAISCIISCTVTPGKQEDIHGDTLKQISIPFAGQTSKEAEIILEKDTVLPNEDKIRLTVRNSSPHTIRTGNEHYLDRWNGKEWERIDLNATDDGTIIVFDAIGYELAPGKEMIQHAHLLRDMHHYTAGRYRICWPFTENGKKRLLTKEFYMEE